MSSSQKAVLRSRPLLEILEAREVPAQINLVGGILTIRGEIGPDVVSV